MPQSGWIFRALVASPSDCSHERRIIPEVVAAWNAVHSLSTGAIVEPVLWETHAYPALGNRPQQLINDQIVAGCDLVIGSFWTRLGTPTGAAESGTAEEIEQFRTAGKPVLVYFSSAPVVPESLDPVQYKALTDYRDRLTQRGLCFKYESPGEFREQLHRHLASQMIALLRTVGSAPASGSAEAPDRGAQEQALRRFLADYQTFLRRTEAEWTSERDSGPHSGDDGKYILGRVADEVLHFKSMIENDNLGISEKLGDCLKRLKAIQRHRFYMDGGVSFAAFWAEGDKILSDLEAVTELLRKAVAPVAK